MTHKYLRIRDQVIAQALKTAGNRVLSEHEICRLFGVSRTTAIKALNSLAADRLVRREVGRGTFLQRRKANTVAHLLINGRDQPIVDYATRLAGAFTDANPDVDVHVDRVDASDLLREIVTRPGTKVVLAGHVGYLSDAGFLQPLHGLDGFNSLCDGILAERITWRRDPDGGRRCDSLPLMLTPDRLVINRRHARALGVDPDRGPADWNELAAWMSEARRLAHHGQPVMGAALKKGYMLPLAYLCSLHGNRHVIRDDGTATRLAFEHGEDWLAFFHGLHHSGALTYYTADRPEPVLFGNALACLTANTWIIGQRQALAPDEDLALLPIPPPRRGGQACSLVGMTEVAMVRQLDANPRDVEAAWRLIRFMVGDLAAQRLLTSTFTALSIHRGLHAEQRADPRYRPFVDALDHGVVRSDHPLQHQLLRIVHKYFNECVLGGMEPARAAARIADACALQLEISQLRIG